MKEIKFRAWDKTEKTMINVVTGMHIAVVFENPKRFHVMQFTGIEDRNGVEIYEGDILNSIHNPDYRMIVKWSEYLLAWIVGSGNFDDSNLAFSSYGVVVGNIYENPELLGKTT